MRLRFEIRDKMIVRSGLPDELCTVELKPASSQDSTSFVTFRACIEALSLMQVDLFILENVDLEDSSDSNLDNIVKMLSVCGPGYSCKVYQLISSDFGIPQRRVRIYIIGFNQRSQGTANFTRVDHYLELFKIRPLPVEAQHNLIINE